MSKLLIFNCTTLEQNVENNKSIIEIVDILKVITRFTKYEEIDRVLILGGSIILNNLLHR